MHGCHIKLVTLNQHILHLIPCCDLWPQQQMRVLMLHLWCKFGWKSIKHLEDRTKYLSWFHSNKHSVGVCVWGWSGGGGGVSPRQWPGSYSWVGKTNFLNLYSFCSIFFHIPVLILLQSKWSFHHSWWPTTNKSISINKQTHEQGIRFYQRLSYSNGAS